MLGRRILAQAQIDLQTIVDLAAEQGISDEALVDRLLRDLDNNGPVFGKMLRSLSGAAAATLRAAAAQGEAMGLALRDPELSVRAARALRNVRGSVLDAVEQGDAEAAAIIETEVIAEVEHTWVATLINTCHLCLPLHGASMPLREWRARGMSPETIHSDQGWESSCKCKLVPTKQAGAHKDLVAPLKRAKLPKGGRRTQRQIGQVDIDAALAARDAALKSEAGRATLARLGRAGGG